MDIRILYPQLRQKGWRSHLASTANVLLGFERVQRLFMEGCQEQPDNPFAAALQQMDMTLDARGVLEAIPKEGATVVVANHPFGGADAVAMSALCLAARRDVSIFANAASLELSGIERWILPLSILNEAEAVRDNMRSMKKALNRLKGGGLVLIFPAGAVSRWDKQRAKQVDTQWSEHAIALAEKTGAPILPVRFFGSPPAWLELLGGIHPLLRTAFIVRGFLAMEHETIRCRKGDLCRVESLFSSQLSSPMERRKQATQQLFNKLYSIDF